MGVRPSRLVAGLAVAMGVVAGALGLAGAGASGAVQSPAHFPGDTIVEVTGDKANGFGIQHLDGSALFPPTDSEARAECSEYDTKVDRVRCRTEVRTWYRDLGDLKVALAYAHSH
jgi:hypothetical protein